MRENEGSLEFFLDYTGRCKNSEKKCFEEIKIGILIVYFSAFLPAEEALGKRFWPGEKSVGGEPLLLSTLLFPPPPPPDGGWKADPNELLTDDSELDAAVVVAAVAPAPVVA